MRTGVLAMFVSPLVLSPGMAMADVTVTARPQATRSQEFLAAGTVRSVSPTGQEFTLVDGTTLALPGASTVLLDNLRPGSFVTAAYERVNGQNVVTSISVQKSAPGR